MQHPFQCLLYCSQSYEHQILVAAAGPYIHTFDVNNGVHLSTWPPPDSKSHSIVEVEDKSNGGNGVAEQNTDKYEHHRAAKRRKISPVYGGSESSSAEIVVESNSNEIPQPPNPPIVKLIATRDGHYVVAVTGEDKSIRVLLLLANGTLEQVNERYAAVTVFKIFTGSCVVRSMPKRPCALAMTSDDLTIICADKFGDVYALPLLGQTCRAPRDNGTNGTHSAIQAKHEAPKRFVPSATSLTVHTKKNRDALRQQQNLTKNTSQKKSMNFEHRLVVGHVSLLTDVACASLQDSTGTLRSYILTADRDEHIRVSRGTPQAHIIEGYCLGHTQFVSKLCLLPHYPRLMISGGGDDYLLLWDWHAGQMKQRVDLRGPVDDFKAKEYTPAPPTNEVRSSDAGAGGFAEPIAVSNIHVLGSHCGSKSDLIRIIVILEGSVIKSANALATY